MQIIPTSLTIVELFVCIQEGVTANLLILLLKSDTLRLLASNFHEL